MKLLVREMTGSRQEDQGGVLGFLMKKKAENELRAPAAKTQESRPQPVPREESKEVVVEESKELAREKPFR